MSSNVYITNASQSLVSELDLLSVQLMKNKSTELLVRSEKSRDWISYYLHDYWNGEGNRNVTHLPFLSDGPLTVLIIMSAYLLFVTRIGPRLMASRPAMELRQPMLMYNTLMVVFNAYFFIKFIIHSDYGRGFANFQFPSKYDNSAKAQALIQTSYLYFSSTYWTQYFSYYAKRTDRSVDYISIITQLCHSWPG